MRHYELNHPFGGPKGGTATYNIDLYLRSNGTVKMRTLTVQGKLGIPVDWGWFRNGTMITCGTWQLNDKGHIIIVDTNGGDMRLDQFLANPNPRPMPFDVKDASSQQSAAPLSRHPQTDDLEEEP